MNQSAAIPFTVLCNLQEVRDQLSEDARRLYFHDAVDQQIATFLDKVNRTDCSAEGRDARLDLRVDKIPRGGHVPTGKAEQLLRDWYTHGAYPGTTLPPPAWLRLLPACLKAVNESNLFSDDDSGLRWLAFNIEVPRMDRDRRIEKTVNINSNIAFKSVSLALCEDGKKCNSLSDILFDFTKAVRTAGETDVATLYDMPYLSWAIRFRTASAKSSPKGAYAPWIDVQVDLDNSKAATEMRGIDALQNDEPINFKCAIPSHPFPQDQRWHDFLDHITQLWACLKGSRRVNNQVDRYCRTLQDFYPDGRWPKDGIDCLLCPGFFWSADSSYRGTAATIFWGFEKPLTREQCIYLLFVSQILLPPLVNISASADIRDTRTERGQSAAFRAYGHEVRNCISALFSNYFAPITKMGARSTRGGQADLFRSLPTNWQVCPVPDIFDTVRAQMLVHAGDKAESLDLLQGTAALRPSLRQGLERLFELGRKVATLPRVSGVVEGDGGGALLRRWEHSLASRATLSPPDALAHPLCWSLDRSDSVSRRRTHFIRIFIAACANAIQHSPDQSKIELKIHCDLQEHFIMVSLLNERRKDETKTEDHFGTEAVLRILLQNFPGLRVGNLSAFCACGQDWQDDVQGEYWNTSFSVPYRSGEDDAESWQWLVPTEGEYI